MNTTETAFDTNMPVIDLPPDNQAQAMKLREQRGMMIAATCRLTHKGDQWQVPSQSGNGKYTVHTDPQNPSCTCPDHGKMGKKCKHIFAVEFASKREEQPDGSTKITETVTLTETIKRKTYPQVWTAYNSAQTNEKDKFQMLLHDLCRGIPEPPPAKTGRPRITLTDIVFAACFKVYSTFSGRRFMSDLRHAQDNGHITKTPHFNSIFNYLENPNLTQILANLITESSLPLKAVESHFAVDSSGFSTSRFVRWFDHKYGVVKQQHDWVKVHLMCGVKTNVVTAVEILDRDAADSPQFKPLVDTTAKRFKIGKVSADKAYTSLENFEAVADHGGTLFSMFKSNATGAVGGMYKQMFHYFSFRQHEFMDHYHKRSNVESTFSMIKAKFRDHVRSKTDVSMKNEVLCKIICHNICCLVQEMYELGIEPEFWSKATETVEAVA